MASAAAASIGYNFVDPKSVSPNAPERFQKGTVIMPLAPKQAATIFYSWVFQILAFTIFSLLSICKLQTPRHNIRYDTNHTYKYKLLEMFNI